MERGKEKIDKNAGEADWQVFPRTGNPTLSGACQDAGIHAIGVTAKHPLTAPSFYQKSVDESLNKWSCKKSSWVGLSGSQLAVQLKAEQM